MPDLILSSEQQATLTAEFLDPAGKPAAVNGTPVWSVDNPALAQLLPVANADGSANPLSVIFYPADGAVGTATASCAADADLHGGGPEPVTLTSVIQVIAPEASAGTIAASPPVVKQAPSATGASGSGATGTAAGSSLAAGVAGGTSSP